MSFKATLSTINTPIVLSLRAQSSNSRAIRYYIICIVLLLNMSTKNYPPVYQGNYIKYALSKDYFVLVLVFLS